MYILHLEECSRTKTWPQVEILDRVTKRLEAPTGREKIEDRLNNVSTSVPGTPYSALNPSPTSPTPRLSLESPVSGHRTNRQESTSLWSDGNNNSRGLPLIHSFKVTDQIGSLSLTARTIGEGIVLTGVFSEDTGDIMSQFRTCIALKCDYNTPDSTIERHAIRYLPLLLRRSATVTYNNLNRVVLEWSSEDKLTDVQARGVNTSPVTRRTWAGLKSLQHSSAHPTS